MTPDNVNGILNALADRFGTTVAQLWAVLVRQQVTGAIVDLLVSAVLLALMFPTARAIRRLTQKLVRNSLDVDTPLAIAGFSLVFVGLGIASAIMVPDAVKHLLNPQYYALNDILTALR